MNQRHKKFILEKLIPFIKREQGRGFAMSVWQSHFDEEGALAREDSLKRIVPSCGTVACIGGSIDVLKERLDENDEQAGKDIGLTYEEARGLFYAWKKQPDDYTCAWPKRFRTRYRKAKTPAAKVRVACDLLKEVVRTNAKCLHSE